MVPTGADLVHRHPEALSSEGRPTRAREDPSELLTPGPRYPRTTPSIAVTGCSFATTSGTITRKRLPSGDASNDTQHLVAMAKSATGVPSSTIVRRRAYLRGRRGSHQRHGPQIERPGLGPLLVSQLPPVRGHVIGCLEPGALGHERLVAAGAHIATYQAQRTAAGGGEDHGVAAGHHDALDFRERIVESAPISSKASACCGASRPTSSARRWGRYRKFVASATAKNPVDRFIDPAGYRAYIDAAETEFRQGVLH